MVKADAGRILCIVGQVADMQHRDFEPVEHTLEGDFLHVAD